MGQKDPLAAGEWLNNRESGPKLDASLAAYANTVALKDGGAAMEWAISISDPKLQQATIKKVGQEWYRQDKESVRHGCLIVVWRKLSKKVFEIHLKKLVAINARKVT